MDTRTPSVGPRGADVDAARTGEQARGRRAWVRRFARARAARARSYRSRGLAWRALAPAVFVLAGALFVTSAVSSDGTDLRAGRYGDLSSVVRQHTAEVDALNAERDAVAAEVERLTEALGGTGVGAAQEQVDRLKVPAGLAAMAGPGLTVELDDAPDDQIAASGVDPNYLVVHQQDIQAVVNAMWGGGAEAMTIQGQRVIATTGIKCVGSTVVLRGVPYAPPYVITAVGDPAAMLDSIDESPYIQRYQEYADRFDLGWRLNTHADVELPAFSGPLDLEYAHPAGARSTREDEDL